MLTQVLFVVSALVSAATASPLVARQSGVTILSDAQVDVYTPYTHYASAAYCPANQTKNWSCGGLYAPLYTILSLTDNGEYS